MKQFAVAVLAAFFVSACSTTAIIERAAVDCNTALDDITTLNEAITAAKAAKAGRWVVREGLVTFLPGYAQFAPLTGEISYPVERLIDARERIKGECGL